MVLVVCFVFLVWDENLMKFFLKDFVFNCVYVKIDIVVGYSEV